MALTPDEFERLTEKVSDDVREKLEDRHESKKLKVEYLLKRLDDTLQFTFSITRLIYLASGGGWRAGKGRMRWRSQS